MTRSGLRALLVLVALYVVLAIRYPGFGGARVPVNLLNDQAVLGLVALGETLVILAGGIDLSVGAAMAFASVVIAQLVQHGVPPFFAFALACLIGTAAGALMGACIARLGVPAFLVTLAGMFAFRGAALALQPGATSIDDMGQRSLGELGLGIAAGVQLGIGAILWLVLVAASALWLGRARTGRAVFALGGNQEAALLLGVPVVRTRVVPEHAEALGVDPVKPACPNRSTEGA